MIHGQPGHTVDTLPNQNHASILTYLIQPPTMPPNRSEFRQKSAEQEGRALQAHQRGQIKSLRDAKLYDVPKTILQESAAGITSRVDNRWHLYKLTQFEEDSLFEWTTSIDPWHSA